ncbi:MAG: hypothetical protein ACYC2I_06570 [Elusimicrobiales bacterium]
MELAKGAKLEAASYDKTQKIEVVAGMVTVGGMAGIAKVSGIATGRHNASIDGTLGIWLSIFRYMRPDGTTDHVAGWNIMVSAAAGQSAEATAKAFAEQINSGTRPYKATTDGARVAIVFTGGQSHREGAEK